VPHSIYVYLTCLSTRDYNRPVFIREIAKKNPGYPKPFIYHRLMESIRTPRGPRQRTILNLGILDIPREEWKVLANRIEEVVTGQGSFLSPSPRIEVLAQHYAGMLQQKEMASVPVASLEPAWETVDLNSLHTSVFRTIGGEIAGKWAFEKLGFPGLLGGMGMNRKEIDQVALLVIGRLLHPASERETAFWGQHISALGDLLGADYGHLSHNAIYRISDRLCLKRDHIEAMLAEHEREAYGLKEKIILYDLTNTYLAGSGKRSKLARYGRSKQKRSDSPLLTLALVIDEDGFPKASKVLAGNVSEPETLQEFLKTYKMEFQKRLPLFTDLPTVVIDAGIATKENLKLVRGEGFHYITVSRVRPKTEPQDGLLVIRKEKESTVEVKRIDDDDEVILYCRSSGRASKEEGMKSRFQQYFEEGLAAIAASLSKKQGQKDYGKIMERIGRLKGKYPRVARFYQIEVIHEKEKVSEIKWEIERKDDLEMRFSGSYYIRSDRNDLDEKELWELYMTLTGVEEAFRCLKSELGLRPTYHQKDIRLEGHLFISVLAYHLLACIQKELSVKGINHRWETIRKWLASHMLATTSVTNNKGERIYQRQIGDPESFHLQVYHALGVSPHPLGIKRWKK
jgi:transposase